MSCSRRQRPWAARFVLLAMVLATLAPGVARALAFAQGTLAPWGAICSAQGQADGAARDPADAVAHALDHCPLCTAAGHAPGLPPAAPALLPMPALSQAVPALFLQAPQRLHAWRAAQPRAPPLAG